MQQKRILNGIWLDMFVFISFTFRPVESSNVKKTITKVVQIVLMKTSNQSEIFQIFRTRKPSYGRSYF